MPRIGHGYDVHKFAEGRKLILGGVTVDYEKGLLGHSDADVLVHAIMDALLGAAGMKDIGGLFPDNDEAYKDVDSMLLLVKVKDLLDENDYEIGNIDCTILAQEPKLCSYISLMLEKISGVLKIPKNNINIKATTEEGLGFTGQKLGIAAHCVCILFH